MATQTEVARHLSLTDRQLRRLQKLPGAPISNKRGQLDLDAWRDFYISYLRRSKNDVPDGDSKEDYEEKLLIARWELTAEQAVTQQLKNEVSKGNLLTPGSVFLPSVSWQWRYPVRLIPSLYPCSDSFLI
ncbi:prophage Qin DNA packaging NU1-like protein [Escherichia coli DEC5A]|nr:prophage Qin DNA packaging NU1-like protein [Escherichia coli DEC5A]